nr:GNAT family N-acetyltransferase [uncultured Desulfuromonas sp.]
MNQYELIALDRSEYVKSIGQLKNDKSNGFAEMSLVWWDKKHGWYSQGCFALTDEQKLHLCYIFFKINKSTDYLTIHNIFTPDAHRRLGYAHILLKLVFDHAIAHKMTRFNLTCISQSLNFYLALGLIYWGVNSVGDFYCDLPMPKDGLRGIKKMVAQQTDSELIGSEFATINHKTNDHNLHLTEQQDEVYQHDLLLLKSNYRREEFLEIRKRRKAKETSRRP